MEKIYDSNTFPVDSLIRITIHKSCIGKMRKSLLSHGITESVIYPDLDGLAMEIKRIYDF